MNAPGDFHTAEANAEPGERLWYFECAVGTLTGYIAAPDADAAMTRALETAEAQAFDAIGNGTWTLREQED